MISGWLKRNRTSTWSRSQNSFILWKTNLPTIRSSLKTSPLLAWNKNWQTRLWRRSGKSWTWASISGSTSTCTPSAKLNPSRPSHSSRHKPQLKEVITLRRCRTLWWHKGRTDEEAWACTQAWTSVTTTLQSKTIQSTLKAVNSSTVTTTPMIASWRTSKCSSLWGCPPCFQIRTWWTLIHSRKWRSRSTCFLPNISRIVTGS